MDKKPVKKEVVKVKEVKRTKHTLISDYYNDKKGDVLALTEKGENYLRKLKKIK